MAEANLLMLLVGVIGILISALSAGCAVVMAVWRMSGKFVEKTDCEHSRVDCDKLRAQQDAADQKEAGYLRQSIDELKQSNRTQYHMLRALVAHMTNLSPSDRERILNAENGRK